MTDLVGPIKLRRGTAAAIEAVTTAADGEPFYSTDTGKLYVADETGVPQLLPSGGVRSTVTYTTASLAAGASETGSFTAPPSFAIGKGSVNYPARVRVYLSSAQRDADLARSATTEASGNHGCILEDILIAGALALEAPAAPFIHPTGGTTAYISVTNNDTVSRAITVTLELLSMEG